MTFSVFDRMMMAAALQLARKGLYTTDPNPRVGCVLTQGEQIVGSGWHEHAGEGHAEVNALADARDANGGTDVNSGAKGATAYVTLEPCSHFGRTPPCAQALIDAGVRRVVAAMQDPNPLVAGKGFALLNAAGIETQSGLLDAEAQQLNPGFIKRMQTGRPWVRVKMAMSIDGRTAMASGESQWITGVAARQDVQRLRARSSAIVTGSGTVLYDNPSLTVRPDELGESLQSVAADIARRQPIRVVVSSQAEFSSELNIFQSSGDVILATAPNAMLSDALQANARISHWPLSLNECGRPDLGALLDKLAAHGCNEVLVEAGAGLSGAFIEADLVDEIFIYMAPKLLGSRARPLFELPFDTMAEQRGLVLQEMCQLGQDIRFIFHRIV